MMQKIYDEDATELIISHNGLQSKAILVSQTGLSRLRKIEAAVKQILISYTVGENNFEMMDDLRKALGGGKMKNEGESMETRYVIVRTYSAGVFAGEFVSRSGQEVILKNARRLWYWTGSASLSQMAMEGTSSPSTCKFPCPVDQVELLQAIEILDCTEKAKASIGSVPVWKQ